MSALSRPLRLPAPSVRVRERAVVMALVAVVLVAGVLRVAEATGPHGPLSADEGAYAALAADVAGDAPYGSGMREPFHWPPGAPVLFGLAQAVDPGDTLRGVFLLQALLGTLLVLVVFALGRALAGGRVGLVAAAIVAVYPPLVGLSGSVLSEGPGTLLLALTTLATVVAAKRAGPRWTWAGAGVLWGATILTRADFLFAPLLVAAVLLLAGRRLTRAGLEGSVAGSDAAVERGVRARSAAAGRGVRARGAAVLLLAVAATLAPWSAYASSRAGGFVPVTTGGGPALFVGTYLPGGGTTIGAKRALAADVAAEHPATADEPASRMSASLLMGVVAQRHPGRERDAAIAAEARRNLARFPLGDPVAYAGMTLDKLRRMWLTPSRAGDPAPQPAVVSLLHPVLVIAAAAFALLALWRTRSLLLALALVPVVSAAALHAVVVANPRYALVTLPLLAVAGVAGARHAALARRSGARVAPATRRVSIRSR